MNRPIFNIRESEHISVEDFGPMVPSPLSMLEYPPDMDLDEFLRDPNLSGITAEGQCNQEDLFGKKNGLRKNYDRTCSFLSASLMPGNTPSDLDMYVTQPTQTCNRSMINSNEQSISFHLDDLPTCNSVPLFPEILPALTTRRFIDRRSGPIAILHFFSFAEKEDCDRKLDSVVRLRWCWCNSADRSTIPHHHFAQ